MNHRLILIDGISGSGKTSIGQFLKRQYMLSGFSSRFLHEFHAPHPIHEWEITDAEKWVTLTLNHWRKFTEEMVSSDDIVIMDATVFQGTCGVLLELDADRDVIFNFALPVPGIIEPLNPALIYLYQADYRKALIKIYNEREERIKVKKENYVRTIKYGQNRNLHGHEGYMQFVGELRDLSLNLFDQYEMSKIKIDNSDGDFIKLHKRILRFLDIPYKEDSFPRSDYIGLYRDMDSGRECRISPGPEDGLEIQGFFPIIKSLCRQGGDIFQIRGKAHELIFGRDNNNRVSDMISRWYIKESEDTVWKKVND